VHDETAKEMLLKLAEDYDRLGDRAIDRRTADKKGEVGP
jgi:hypothetical protein